MAGQARVKFATQVNAHILQAVRDLAEREGRSLQSLVEEALADLIEKHKAAPRPHVMDAYRASLEPFGTLYKNFRRDGLPNSYHARG